VNFLVGIFRLEFDTEGLNQQGGEINHSDRAGKFNYNQYKCVEINGGFVTNTACSTFRFYAELNGFISKNRRFRSFRYPLGVRQSVKDAIEALGVPHTEVDLILVDGESVSFEFNLDGDEQISVFPRFESINISPILKVRPKPLREPRFVADVHLGRLAGYLRLLGFDTYYGRALADEELAAISGEQGRILITRDRGLLKRNSVRHGYLVRSTLPKEQLVEVLHRFDLENSIEIATRCTHCNSALKEVEKERILDRLQPDTASIYHSFMQCEGCERIYWKGSHYQKILQLVQEITAALKTHRNRIG
jgi:uncharacterized protein with PIN domain